MKQEDIDWLEGICGVYSKDVIDFFAKQDKYRKGFYILMDYFDSISEEEKPMVSKQLAELGI